MIETNRQGVVDPLAAMLFTAVNEQLSKDACRRTLPIFDGQQRYDLKLAFKRMDKAAAEKGYAGPVVVCSLRYEPYRRPQRVQLSRQIRFRKAVKWSWRSHRLPARAGWHQFGSQSPAQSRTS